MASVRDIKLPTHQELPDGYVALAFDRLNHEERSQLGNGSCIHPDLWPQIRYYLSLRSIYHQDGELTDEYTAFTPHETRVLLGKSIIQNWWGDMSEYNIPDKYKLIAFVPCAKTKPWLNATQGIYSSYNQIARDFPEVCLVTISEPLGVVPFTFWDSFPRYDNPGLFRGDTLRAGMYGDEWEAIGFPKNSRLPGDEEWRQWCLHSLADAIKAFCERNKNIPLMSFVDDEPWYGKITSASGTHTEMITYAGIEVIRHTKRSVAREQPYIHMARKLTAYLYPDRVEADRIKPIGRTIMKESESGLGTVAEVDRNALIGDPLIEDDDDQWEEFTPSTQTIRVMQPRVEYPAVTYRRNTLDFNIPASAFFKDCEFAKFLVNKKKMRIGFRLSKLALPDTFKATVTGNQRNRRQLAITQLIRFYELKYMKSRMYELHEKDGVYFFNYEIETDPAVIQLIDNPPAKVKREPKPEGGGNGGNGGNGKNGSLAPTGKTLRVNEVLQFSPDEIPEVDD